MTGDDSTKKENQKKLNILRRTLTKPNTQKEPMDNLSINILIVKDEERSQVRGKGLHKAKCSSGKTKFLNFFMVLTWASHAN